MDKEWRNKKLRILHVAKWYPNQGDVQNGVFVQKHIMVSQNFAEAKVLAWLPGERTMHTEAIENGVSVMRHYFSSKATLPQKRQALRAYIHSHYNDKNLPHLVHLHIFSPDLLLVLKWAQKKQIPVVISAHWSGFIRGVFSSMPFWKKWAFKKLGGVQRILPVSEYLQLHMQQCGVRGNFKVLPNVVEANPHQPAKLANFSFVVVADLVDEIKNISGILSAFEALNHATAELHIFGGGPDEEALKSRAQKLKKSPQITFHGRVANADLLAQLPQFHCLINNSLVESFGVTVLEAHAAEIPVISTLCGGPNEWLESSDFPIEIDSQTQLVQAMKSAIAEQNKKVQFVKWQACLPENVAENLQAIYREVLAEHSAQPKRKKKFRNSTKR